MKQEAKNRKRMPDLQDAQDLARSQMGSMGQYGQITRPRPETTINHQFSDNNSVIPLINNSRPHLVNSLNMPGDMVQQHYGSYPAQQTQFFYPQQNTTQGSRPMMFQEFPQQQQQLSQPQQQPQLRQYDKVSPSQPQYDPQQFDPHQHYYQQQQSLPQRHSSPISEFPPQTGSYSNLINQPGQSRLNPESSQISDEMLQPQRISTHSKEGQRSDVRQIPSDYQQVDDPESPKSKLRNGNRGNYICRKCGEPKKGHVCAYQTRSIPKNDGNKPPTAEVGIQVELDEEMTVRKLKLEIQGLPESYCPIEQNKNSNSNNFQLKTEEIINGPGVQTKLPRPISHQNDDNDDDDDDDEDDEEEDDDDD